MNETLGTSTSWGITEPIQSNDFPTCLKCGVKITKENDSGWEAFTKDGRTTQPVCQACWDNEDKDIGLKQKEI